jgi:hypothetical protein
MNIKKFQTIIAEAIYLFLIFFFCYTAANKLVKIDSFRTNLIKTSIFSKDFADIFSILIIGLEIAIVLFMLYNKKKGLLSFCATMLIFTLYISFLHHKGLYEVCGCGGILNGLAYQYHFMINVWLIVGSLFSFYTFNYTTYEK